MDWDALRHEFPITKRWALFDHAAVAPLTGRTIVALHEYALDLADNGVVNDPRWRKRIERGGFGQENQERDQRRRRGGVRAVEHRADALNSKSVRQIAVELHSFIRFNQAATVYNEEMEE